MNSVYFDTNIYLYLNSSTEKQKNTDCIALINNLAKANRTITTSFETIQEIINWSNQTKNRKIGLEIARDTIMMCTNLLTVNEKTIEIFLIKAQKYQLNHSRDLLHLATCLEHNIKEIVTYDSAFQNFKEIRAFTPQEYNEVFLSDDK